MVNKLKQNMHLLPDCISFKFETISFALAMQSSKLDRGMMNNDRVMLKVELSRWEKLSSHIPRLR